MSASIYRKLYLMPKRKLNAQLAIERITGRAENPMVSGGDIFDRMVRRTPRKEEMRTDQEWTDVWPAAASFKSSVVPLNIRMGYRNKPEKRAPFQTVGNLELVKIPNFLHLTPKHIELHCKAIKKFCTPYPKELKNNDELCGKHFPLTIEYSTYVHQGTSIRDMRARIITITGKVENLQLKQEEKDKFLHLIADRYNYKAKTFIITTDRCPSRIQNLDYANYILTALYFESKKKQKWEQTIERVDKLKLEFEGSSVQERILKMKNIDKSDSKIKKFAEMWYDYRNQPETPETTRKYADAVRLILGINSLKNEEKSVDL